MQQICLVFCNSLMTFYFVWKQDSNFEINLMFFITNIPKWYLNIKIMDLIDWLWLNDCSENSEFLTKSRWNSSFKLNVKDIEYFVDSIQNSRLQKKGCTNCVYTMHNGTYPVKRSHLRFAYLSIIHEMFFLCF